jgi:ubiquitin carboxyl-terminal hydrolase 34
VWYIQDLWQLFHPKLSEPSIPVHQNKQALLHFWYTATTDCQENVRLILTNNHVVKNIAFNYILADHEDTDVVNFNRVMLPTYHGLLRQGLV